MLYQERIHTERIGAPWIRDQHVARYLWASKFAENRRVLDVGCGNAYRVSSMVSRGSRTVDAIDKSLDTIFIARQEQQSGDRLTYIVGDGCRLPLKAGTYDLVISFETIEHVEDDTAFLAEVVRILAPEGLFLCSTPNRRLSSPGNSRHDKPANPFHQQEYDPNAFGLLLGQYFHNLTLFSQSPYSGAYVRLLSYLGRTHRTIPIFVHRLRKLCALPWNSIERQYPRRFSSSLEPEIIMAVCSGKIL